MPLTEEDGRSFVSGSVVDWLQSAGLEVVPIPYTYSPTHVHHLVNSIHGLFLQGGPVFNMRYRTLVAALLQEIHRRYILLQEEHGDGAYVPVWGVCHGLEMALSTYGGIWPLETFNAVGRHSAVLRPTAEGIREGRLLRARGALRRFPRNAIFSHSYGMSPSLFRQNNVLTDHFRILATTRDRNGVPYVSLVEGRTMPIYLMQFHPEMDRNFAWMAQAFGQEVTYAAQQRGALPRRRSELRLEERTGCPDAEQEIVSDAGCFLF